MLFDGLSPGNPDIDFVLVSQSISLVLCDVSFFVNLRFCTHPPLLRGRLLKTSELQKIYPLI